MGRPCKCCELVSSSSSSTCGCIVSCDINTLCEGDEYPGELGGGGALCPCYGGECSYDMTSGDWSVTIRNAVLPEDFNCMGSPPESIAFCMTCLNTVISDCNPIAVNPSLFPDPTPHALENGPGSSALDQYGTRCRTSPAILPEGPNACGNNSGYACACVTKVTVNGIDVNDPDSPPNDCWTVACSTGTGDPFVPSCGDGVQGKRIQARAAGEETYSPWCLLLGQYCNDPPRCLDKTDVNPDTGQNCNCIAWEVKYEGTSTPPTIDNCDCWTFQLDSGCGALFGGKFSVNTVCFSARNTPSQGWGLNYNCPCGGFINTDSKACLGCTPWEITAGECPEAQYPNQLGFQCEDPRDCDAGVDPQPGPFGDFLNGHTCRFIAFGGAWYPIDMDCEISMTLPPCDAPDGHIISIKNTKLRMT